MNGSYDEQDVLAFIGKYGNLSEEELSRALLDSVRRGRADGSLTDEGLEQMYAMVSPFLSGEQRANMRHIIDALRNS